MGSAQKFCVLIVEDDLDIRDMMTESLQDGGYEVSTAENGLVALNLLQSAQHLPCLIILDLAMPVMDGNTFRREQVKDSTLSKIPTVMISADPALKQKAEQSGVSDYIPKPVALRKLIEVVEKYCGQPK